MQATVSTPSVPDKQLGLITSSVNHTQHTDTTTPDIIDQSPFSLPYVPEAAVASQEQPYQQQQVQHRPVSSRLLRKIKAMLSCSCTQPQAAAGMPGSDLQLQQLHHGHMSDAIPTGHKDSIGRHHITPKSSLIQQHSSVYTDADWFDARSEFSNPTPITSVSSDPASQLQELSQMVRELAPAPPSKAPWIPDPPLVFAQPGLQFMPVPEHTAYAAYWERDPERSTPYPCPCDVLLGASAIVQKVHASIPGMWLQETDKSFSVMVKPTFVPPGLPRYTEMYDKTMATEPSWPMRRDLRLGSTSGQIYMTTEGLLILRARSKPLWGNIDIVMEEYLRLEESGQVIVDRQCLLELKTGRKAIQYLVGRRHDVPPKGHV